MSPASDQQGHDETLGGAPFPTPELDPKITGNHVARGVGFAALLHLLQIPVIFTGAFFAIGLTQLVYMVPAVAICFGRGEPGIAVGLLIGAGLTMLINAACFWYVGILF